MMWHSRRRGVPVLLALVAGTATREYTQAAAAAAAAVAAGAAASSPSSSSLQRFHDVLQTNSRRFFGHDEEAFRLAVDWQHSRLLATAAAAAGDSQGATGLEAAEGEEEEEAVGRRGGTGTFVAFTSHARAARGREALSAALSPTSVLTAAHNREQGGCFIVRASAADVESLLLLLLEEEEEEEESGGTDGVSGGSRLFDGFVAVPPSLKLAPSLLDYGSDFDSSGSGVGVVSGGRDGGSSGRGLAGGDSSTAGAPGLAPAAATGAVASEERRGAGTSPGKALRRNTGGEGLVVQLLLSPGATGSRESALAALAESWKRGWSSDSLDLSRLSFWSDADGHRPREADDEQAPPPPTTTAADFLAREWGSAARTVHSLAERLGGVSPAEACGWNDVRVAAEGGGRSSSAGWVTLRDIGHLLPGAGRDDHAPPPRQARSSNTSGGGNGNRSAESSGVHPASGDGGMDDGGGSASASEREKTACLMGLVSFLAARPEVARVSALPRAELFNAVAGRIVQGGSATTQPIWDRGVDGSGEVVQVVDSGIDEGSCFFRDSATTLGPDHGYLRDYDGTLGAGDYTYDLSQRKVVQYIESTRGDDVYSEDDPDGHGSHVGGSVAGSIYSEWTGPADCPDGVGDATAEQTALSCVGVCLDPNVLDEYVSDNTFDLDALCPEYECDVYWETACLSDDRSETLEEAKGVAPGAKLAVLDLGSSDSLEQALGGTMWEVSAGTGARIHSASWGFIDEPCTVDDSAVSFDEWAYENPEHLLVFAAGNLGDDMVGCSIASPAVSKNCLAVGSSMSGELRLSPGDLDEVSDFSSLGPTTDDRIKPDILAPGHYIFSASNGGEGSCQLDRNSGTSMSCPIAAGAAALVRQYLVDGFYAEDVAARGSLCAAGTDPAWACDAFSPSGALVKALLIHGADAMGGSTDPDGQRGFGRINLDSALPFEGEGVWALYMEDADGSTTSAGQVEAMETEVRAFTVSAEDADTAVAGGSGSGPGGIRATLVWMDPPATTLSPVQLVHDLDLFVEGPDGTTWTMSGQCTSDQDSCSLDDRNNVERVVVPASDITAGTWTVTVSASNDLVEGGPQTYALAVSLPISTAEAESTVAPTTAAPLTTPPSASPTAGPLTGTPAGAVPETPSPTAAATTGSTPPVAATAPPSPSPPTPSPSSGGTATTATPAPTPAGTGAATGPPSSAAAPVGGDGDGGGGGDTPAPSLIIIASPGGGDAPATPAPVMTIASPGTDEDSTPAPSASSIDESDDDGDGSSGDGDDGGDGARAIGGTPSPAEGVEESGTSSGAAVVVVGGGGGGGRLLLCVAAAAVLATAAVGGPGSSSAW